MAVGTAFPPSGERQRRTVPHRRTEGCVGLRLAGARFGVLRARENARKEERALAQPPGGTMGRAAESGAARRALESRLELGIALEGAPGARPVSPAAPMSSRAARGSARGSRSNCAAPQPREVLRCVCSALSPGVSVGGRPPLPPRAEDRLGKTSEEYPRIVGDRLKDPIPAPQRPKKPKAFGRGPAGTGPRSKAREEKRQTMELFSLLLKQYQRLEKCIWCANDF